MKNLVAAAMLLLSMAAVNTGQPVNVPVYDAGVRVGYYGGTGVQLHGTVSELAHGFPLAIRLGAGYTLLDPGNSSVARRVFINNPTNGVPETQGHSWDMRLDFLYRTTMWRSEDSIIFSGPRYVRFLGSFPYVGGNEDFDVVSHPWG